MIELIAENGFIYVNKLDNTIQGKVIILGVNESTDNWEQIPESIEYNEIN